MIDQEHLDEPSDGGFTDLNSTKIAFQIKSFSKNTKNTAPIEMRILPTVVFNRPEYSKDCYKSQNNLIIPTIDGAVGPIPSGHTKALAFNRLKLQ